MPPSKEGTGDAAARQGEVAEDAATAAALERRVAELEGALERERRLHAHTAADFGEQLAIASEALRRTSEELRATHAQLLEDVRADYERRLADLAAPPTSAAQEVKQSHVNVPALRDGQVQGAQKPDPSSVASLYERWCLVTQVDGTWPKKWTQEVRVTELVLWCGEEPCEGVVALSPDAEHVWVDKDKAAAFVKAVVCDLPNLRRLTIHDCASWDLKAPWTGDHTVPVKACERGVAMTYEEAPSQPSNVNVFAPPPKPPWRREDWFPVLASIHLHNCEVTSDSVAKLLHSRHRAFPGKRFVVDIDGVISASLSTRSKKGECDCVWGLKIPVSSAEELLRLWRGTVLDQGSHQPRFDSDTLDVIGSQCDVATLRLTGGACGGDDDGFVSVPADEVALFVTLLVPRLSALQELHLCDYGFWPFELDMNTSKSPFRTRFAITCDRIPWAYDDVEVIFRHMKTVQREEKVPLRVSTRFCQHGLAAEDGRLRAANSHADQWTEYSMSEISERE